MNARGRTVAILADGSSHRSGRRRAFRFETQRKPTPPLIGVVHETEIRIAPEISARLASIGVKPGQEARKGDALAALSSPEVAASLEEAKANAKSARANLANVVAGVRQEKRVRPDVITCMIEGNQDGTTAVDYTVNCATGYPFMTGKPGAGPVNHMLPAWDVACAFQTAFAIAAAADRRRRTGQGAELRLALSDVAFATLSHLGVGPEAELLGQDRPPIGNHIYGAFGRDFATCDDHRIMIAAISAGQWTALVKACGLEAEIAALQQQTGRDFADETERFAARNAIAALIEPWCAARPLAEIRVAFDAHRVCWVVTTAPPPHCSPMIHVSASLIRFGNGLKRRASEPIALLGHPYGQTPKSRGPMTPAPLIGQHTDEILLDVLRLPSAEVGRLHDDGIGAGPEKDRRAAGSTRR